MAVLIEGISVVIRSEAIASIYEGGEAAFNTTIPNGTYCTDGELARVGFMSPDDVRAFVERLEQKGLRYADTTGSAVNIVVVDQQTGFRADCTWARFLRVEVDNDPTHRVAICQLIPTRVQGLAVPANWSYANSLSARYRFVPTENLNQELEFVRHENGVDVYRDRRTGQELYVGRPQGDPR